MNEQRLDVFNRNKLHSHSNCMMKQFVLPKSVVWCTCLVVVLEAILDLT